MAGNRNSGRRPAPTALTVLRGNPSKKNLNENEPVPPVGTAEKPTWLPAGAGPVGDELAPVCAGLGPLTVADQRAFATLCELQSTLQQTSASKDGRQLFRLERDGASESDPMEIVIDAVLRLERETANGLRPYYEYFGLTPASRARIAVPKRASEPESKWAGALA